MAAAATDAANASRWTSSSGRARTSVARTPAARPPRAVSRRSTPVGEGRGGILAALSLPRSRGQRARVRRGQSGTPGWMRAHQRCVPHTWPRKWCTHACMRAPLALCSWLGQWWRRTSERSHRGPRILTSACAHTPLACSPSASGQHTHTTLAQTGLHGDRRAAAAGVDAHGRVLSALRPHAVGEKPAGRNVLRGLRNGREARGYAGHDGDLEPCQDCSADPGDKRPGQLASRCFCTARPDCAAARARRGRARVADEELLAAQVAGGPLEGELCHCAEAAAGVDAVGRDVSGGWLSRPPHARSQNRRQGPSPLSRLFCSRTVAEKTPSRPSHPARRCDGPCVCRLATSAVCGRVACSPLAALRLLLRSVPSDAWAASL